MIQMKIILGYQYRSITQGKKNFAKPEAENETDILTKEFGEVNMSRHLLPTKRNIRNYV